MTIGWLYLYLVLASLFIAVADTLRRLYNFRALRDQPAVILELIPPAFLRKAPLATEQLFSVLHTMSLRQPWRNHLLGRISTFSFEIASTRSDGIRYLVRLARADAPVFEQQLAAYLPDVRFSEATDYFERQVPHDSVMAFSEYKQARHFAFPLASHDSLSQHDPMAYITGSMTKLQPDEVIAFQLVLSPVAPHEASSIRNNILVGREPNLWQPKSLLWRLLWMLILLPFWLLKTLLGMITEMTRPTDEASMRRYTQRLVSEQKPARTPAYQAMLGGLDDKLSQRLFQVSIRTMVLSTDRLHCDERTDGMQAALGAFAVPGYQGLVAKPAPFFLFRKYLSRRRMQTFEQRLPTPFMKQANVLSVAEVASLYHFPYGETARPENLQASRSRNLPAPVALKQREDEQSYDVILGRNSYHGSDTLIGLSADERERHVYILGGTGNGKTTMLQYAIIQDIQNGKGLAVVDPHGDMAETILCQIPEERLKDVIYLNPIDIEYPIGLNLLELPVGLSDNEILIEKDRITESIISVFRKVFSDDDSGGHRIEYILRNAIHTAFTVENATLFTIFRLLTDIDYQKSVIKNLTDQDLKNFWKNELGKAGEFQRVKMSAGVTSKIGRFLFSASARRVLEQPKSTIDFEAILDSGKILICNFSKGNLGEDTSALFGTVTLAKLQLAALRRARQAQTDRQPFYLYVDEFQNFATMSFLQMLSEARKYKLFLTMAEQSPSQQEQLRMVSIILANVGTVICFRSASPMDEELLLPLFQPYIEKGEILNLPTFQFYMRLAAVQSHEPLSGETLLLKDDGDEVVADEVKALSRRLYGNEYVAEQPAVVKSKKSAKKSRAKKPKEVFGKAIRS
ncbi:MAG: DUF87 domain-containing protein [Candidatus Saccharibacteria bacterium]